MKNLNAFQEPALQTVRRNPLTAPARWRGFLLRLWKGENGQSLVEAAFYLPILATVLVGVIQCGLLFSNYIQLTNAVGQGADYLQTIRQTSTDPCRDTFTAIANAAAILKPANITLTIILNNTSSTTASASTFSGTGTLSCSGSQSLLISLAPATVTVSYPASLVIYGKNYFGAGATITQSVTIYEN